MKVSGLLSSAKSSSLRSASIGRSFPPDEIYSRGAPQIHCHHDFAVPAVDWFKAYQRNALETLIGLYDDHATQACACEGPKLIAGKQALRAYWIDRFTTYPVNGLAGLTSAHNGASVLFWSNDSVVQARLIFNEQGKIAHVICGPQGAQIRPLSNPATN